MLSMFSLAYIFFSAVKKNGIFITVFFKELTFGYIKSILSKVYIFYFFFLIGIFVKIIFFIFCTKL